MKQLLLIGLFFIANSGLGKTLKIDASLNMGHLLKEFDQDGDKKITILDKKAHKGIFYLKDLNGSVSEFRGVYPLANLLQELKLQTEDGVSPDSLQTERIFENPVERLSRMIRHYYWDALTRRIDQKHLAEVMPDSKLPHQKNNILYVPESDPEALKYFSQAKNVSIKIVPSHYDLTYLKSLQNQHGLLSLKVGVPYVVPGGRFNEMYGWDSYFQIRGLLQDQKLELALGLVDNLVYEITHYGKILNANRTYYLSRSQPPFLTSMIREVYSEIPPNREWLKASLKAAIKEYETVWMGKDHLTSLGLNRYFGVAPEIPPEVEPGHFDEVLRPYAKKYKLDLKSFKKAFDEGKINEPELQTFFSHDQAVRESGHDTTFRWRNRQKDVCADYVTVDLNSLLYKTELDIAILIETYFAGKLDQYQSADFYTKAKTRKTLMRKYLWHEGKGFFDFNWKTKESSLYQSATNLYPLWAHEASRPETRLMDEKEMNFMVEKMLPELEVAGGVASTSLRSLRAVGGEIHERQWDYPYGWAPHQMLLWQGLRQNGFTKDADRLTYKWLYMITKNAMDFNGTIPEKYDVVKRSHEVFAEYGNVGTKFSYITREGFGWMNASYQVGLAELSKPQLLRLKKLESPD